MMSAVCDGASVKASDKRACLNAVARCMPVVDGMIQDHSSVGDVVDSLRSPHLKSCTKAITQMSPEFVADFIGAQTNNKTCVNPKLARVLKDLPEDVDYGALASNLAESAALLAPYSMQVASLLPECPVPQRLSRI